MDSDDWHASCIDVTYNQYTKGSFMSKCIFAPVHQLAVETAEQHGLAIPLKVNGENLRLKDLMLYLRPLSEAAYILSKKVVNQSQKSKVVIATKCLVSISRKEAV